MSIEYTFLRFRHETYWKSNQKLDKKTCLKEWFRSSRRCCLQTSQLFKNVHIFKALTFLYFTASYFSCKQAISQDYKDKENQDTILVITIQLRLQKTKQPQGSSEQKCCHIHVSMPLMIMPIYMCKNWTYVTSSLLNKLLLCWHEKLLLKIQQEILDWFYSYSQIKIVCWHSSGSLLIVNSKLV